MVACVPFTRDNGYGDSFSSWSYAQDAFNKWAMEFAQRFNQLRGTEATVTR